MSDLPNSPLICFYNGVTFPTETETVGIESRPVPDSSGRAVMYVVHKITVRATIATANQAAGATTDATLAALRQRLTAYGGEFHYENVGFGNLTVNVPPGGPTVGANGKARDAVWGPKPEMLSWKPLGQLAAEVTWSVQVAVPECDTATYAFATMEAVFRLQFDKDESGYTRRVYSGHVRIPQTRATVNTRTLSDSADRLLERVNPPPVPGFRRIPGSATLSEDKCRLDYTITDQEIGPNYPPPGVVEVSCSHTASTDQYYGGQWFGTIRATYELARDTPRSTAFAYFYSVYEDRARQAQNTPFRLAGPKQGQRAAQVVLVRRLEVSEPEVYGKKGAAFSLTYAFMSRVEDIVKASGMWRPVPNSNWQRWATSLANTAFHPRGNAKLRFNPADDAIVDLCAQSQSTLRAGGGPTDTSALRTIGDKTINPTPPPETSWLRYWSVLWLEVLDETVEMKLLPQAPVNPYASSPGNPYLNSPGAAGFLQGQAPQLYRGPSTPFNTQVYASPYASSPGAAGAGGGAVIQQRARPTVAAHLSGFAVRAGYPIAPPALVSVGGVPAVPANRGGPFFGHWIMASWFGLPIVGCWWHFRYLLAGTPASLPLMDTPFLGY